MSLLPFDLPPAFLAAAGRSPEWAAWVGGVPRTIRELLDEWGLVVDGEPVHGWTSVVVPVRAEGRAAVLKVAWPFEECRHEILALQHWHGRGAVLLPGRSETQRAAAGTAVDP